MTDPYKIFLNTDIYNFYVKKTMIYMDKKFDNFLFNLDQHTIFVGCNSYIFKALYVYLNSLKFIINYGSFYSRICYKLFVFFNSNIKFTFIYFTPSFLSPFKMNTFINKQLLIRNNIRNVDNYK